MSKKARHRSTLKKGKKYVVRKHRTADGLTASCPALRCDWCGGPITHAGRAAAVWLSADPVEVSIIHKVHLETCRPGQQSWLSLPHYLGLLIHNLGLDPAELVRLAAGPPDNLEAATVRRRRGAGK